MEYKVSYGLVEGRVLISEVDAGDMFATGQPNTETFTDKDKAYIKAFELGWRSCRHHNLYESYDIGEYVCYENNLYKTTQNIRKLDDLVEIDGVDPTPFICQPMCQWTQLTYQEI